MPPPPPDIGSFFPTHGPVGTTVLIFGVFFTGATSVEFNGTPATFEVITDGRIDATVPGGATTGPISVTTPDGTATSASNFAVDPPANDHDYNAYGDDNYQIPCRPGTVTVHDHNFNATKEVGEPNFDATVGGHSVWWWWNSPGNGTVTIQAHPDYVNGTPLTDPLLLVYDCGDFCDFDHPVAQGHGSVTFTAKQGIDYIIGVDGAAGQEGDFALTLMRPTPPLNDLSVGAEELVGDSGSTSGSTNWACTEDGDPSGFFNVWYKWAPSVSGWAKLTQTLTDALRNGGRQVAVYTGGPGSWVPVLLRSPAGAADIAAGSAWDMYLEVEAGTTYYVIVSGVKDDGVSLDRFELDWLAVMDLADVEPADVVAGPSVSSTTLTLKEPTPGGTWFRFEIEWESGDLPTHDGTLPGHMGLIEFKDLFGNVIGQLRLAGDRLQVRNHSDDTDVFDPWTDIGKAATLGPGLSKTRVEFFYWPDAAEAGVVRGHVRVNGNPAGPALATGPFGGPFLASSYPHMLRYGCLWNGGGDDVAVRIENIGVRVDPDLGPWCSTDPDDEGVTFMWGGEGGELGLSSGGTDWVFSDGVLPPVIPAPGSGPSPGGRYGNAIDCSTGPSGGSRYASCPIGFSMRLPESIYFFVSDHPDTTATIARLTDSDGVTLPDAHAIDVRLGPAGVLSVFMGGEQVGTIRSVSLNRWHHLEVYFDALAPRWALTVRLNGVNFGPFDYRPGGFLGARSPFLPSRFAFGNPDGAANFGIAVKDITAYRQTAFPLGGQTIRKRVPDAVGAHNANVDEWASGVNLQTPITDGDPRFDLSTSAVGDAPFGWGHNLHFGDVVDELVVALAGGAPPAAMVGQKVISYVPAAPPPASGGFVLLPPPSMTAPLGGGPGSNRYLIEAWIRKDSGANGQFDTWGGLVGLQGWPWSDVAADVYGGWLRHSKERAELGTVDQFGFNHNSAANNGHEFEIGPITIWENFVYEPRATGFWQSVDDGVTYTSIQDDDATSFRRIREWPPATGGEIVGVGPATTGWIGAASPAGNSEHYLEYALQDAPDTRIMGARLYVRGRAFNWVNRHIDPTDASVVYPSRAASSAADASLFAQGRSGAARRWLNALFVTRGSEPAGAKGHDSYVMPVDHADAAWTVATWNAWRARLGFPVAAAPDASTPEPIVEAFAVELLLPEPELPPEGGGPILGFSFRAGPQTSPAPSPTSEASAHLSAIEFRT